MPHYTIEELTKDVEEGTIDTVLACIADLRGRLMGKRLTGHHFLDHAAEELHFCDYLLTVDLDMEPIPGFRSASWDLGYGDLIAKPDLDTLRKVPWLEATALVLCDCEDDDGSPGDSGRLTDAAGLTSGGGGNAHPCRLAGSL